MPYKNREDYLKYHIEYNRRKGHKPRSEVMERSNRKGYLAEITAKLHFEKLGYHVTQSAQFGPDLIIEKEGIVATVEVKSSVFTRTSWCVHLVKKKRLSDDYIAIVLPNNEVHVDSMKEHLKLCSGCGKRTITNLVKQYG